MTGHRPATPRPAAPRAAAPRATAPSAATPRGLVTFGEMMGLFRATDIGSLDMARHFTVGIGGSEGNVAMGVARLGGHATWIGRLGDDATGRLAATRMRQAGVDTMVVADPGFTGVMVRHHPSGEVTGVDYHRAASAGSRLSPTDLPDHVLARAAIVHVTGITPALSTTARDATLHAIDAARRAGALVSFDVNFRSKLWSAAEARPILRTIAAAADIVFAGVHEAAVLLGERVAVRAAGLDSAAADGAAADAAAAAADAATSPTSSPAAVASAIAELGPSEVVVKVGAHGCVAQIDGTTMTMRAPRVRVVDPVGAGDAFVAGYLAERLEAHHADARLATAVEAGAYAVTVPGDCDIVPDRADLDVARTVDDVVR